MLGPSTRFSVDPTLDRRETREKRPVDEGSRRDSVCRRAVHFRKLIITRDNRNLLPFSLLTCTAHGSGNRGPLSYIDLQYEGLSPEIKWVYRNEN